MNTTKFQFQEAQIHCGNCGSRKFELKVVWNYEDQTKSIISSCKCGRVVEYRNVEEAIMLTR